MEYVQKLIPGELIRRYKRFLADILLEDGSVVTAHCPNTGSMLGLNEPGNRVYIWESSNPRRRLMYTWELVEADGVLVGINTNRPIPLVREAIERGIITELKSYGLIKTEVNYGNHSRLDFLLSDGSRHCYVEVKNVTLVNGEVAQFPDAVTKRGTKHLQELLQIVKNGKRAVILFVVQREDALRFSPAEEIDPVFAETLEWVVNQGVEVFAYQASISLKRIEIVQKIPVNL